MVPFVVQAEPYTSVRLFCWGGDAVVLTLCRDCLAVFLADQRYIVTPVDSDHCDIHDCECFICRRRGRDYDVEKPGYG